MNLDELLDILKSNQYKITEQRRALMQILTDNHHGLLSVEELFNESKKLYPKTNMSTIYRNIEILESLDLLYKIMNDQGVTQYKLICCDAHHHHIICALCGKTQVIDYCPLSTFESLAKENDYILTGHKLELYGHCKECSKKML